MLQQRFTTRGGEVRDIEVTVRRMTDADGAFSGFAGNIRDVSERVLQERALRASEERCAGWPKRPRSASSAPTGSASSAMSTRACATSWAWMSSRCEQLKLLAENATDAVFRLRLDGTCIYASPSAREQLGVDTTALIGRNMLARFHPSDGGAVEDTIAALRRGEIERRIVAYRSERVTAPGEYLWLEANCGLVRDGETGAPCESSPRSATCPRPRRSTPNSTPRANGPKRPPPRSSPSSPYVSH